MTYYIIYCFSSAVIGTSLLWR